MFEPKDEFEDFEEFESYELEADEPDEGYEADFDDAGEDSSGAYQFDQHLPKDEDEYD